eukprot:scaffold32032_cov108-Isochrysis_galbana.AAC.1
MVPVIFGRAAELRGDAAAPPIMHAVDEAVGALPAVREPGHAESLHGHHRSRASNGPLAPALFLHPLHVNGRRRRVI